jgi:hypothetical protein
MPRGGKRPGAGAKRGNLNSMSADKIVMRQKARDLIGPKMPEMIAAQVAHARGLSYLVYRDKESGRFERVKDIDTVDQSLNTIEVWEKDPSVQAFTDLMNRLLDKPAEQPQELKLSGELAVTERLTAARDRLAKRKREGA